MTTQPEVEPGSSDQRAQTIWQAFVKASEVANHFERARLRFGSKPAWSLIIPVTDADVAERAQEVQQVVGTRHGAVAIAPDRLHITLFTVPVGPPAGWREQIGETLAGVEPFEVAIGGVNAFPESLFLEVVEPREVRRLRETVTAAHGWIGGGVPAQAFLPHISIMYFESDGRADDLAARLGPLRGLEPLRVPIGHLLASSLRFDERGRSERLESAALPLGGAQ